MLQLMIPKQINFILKIKNKIIMNMFCYQCQEAAKNIGCTIKGVCGKTPEVSNLQDALLYLTKGISYFANLANNKNLDVEFADKFVFESLFITITNANFDSQSIIDKIKEGFKIREKLYELLTNNNLLNNNNLPDACKWYSNNKNEILNKAESLRINKKVDDEDITSLRELLIYGLKGIAAYAEHAYNLGFKKKDIFQFMHKALSKTLNENIDKNDLLELIFECGKYGVEVMSLLDEANTKTFGNPEVTKVNLGVDNRPGILISGHDLKDLKELLEQSKDSEIDIYTHCEMLPAHYYPEFKKYKHFKGNYGNAWWKQNEEFEKFNGPILLTTNCLVPPKESYKNRLYTTGPVSFEGCIHISDRKNGEPKDFSIIIEHAKKCPPPTPIENGTIIGGFAHAQVFALADKIVEAVKKGKIKKFVVMAGCDGRINTREYYTKFAELLPKDTIILTAGCAKYRYIKLPLGNIDGIPRVLDAGQCNDSYSLAIIALKLKEIFNFNDINELPIVYNIAWYEQKAVIVLLALLYLGVKNINLGPTLPAFLSTNVKKILSENFGLKGIEAKKENLESAVISDIKNFIF